MIIINGLTNAGGSLDVQIAELVVVVKQEQAQRLEQRHLKLLPNLHINKSIRVQIKHSSNQSKMIMVQRKKKTAILPSSHCYYTLHMFQLQQRVCTQVY